MWLGEAMRTARLARGMSQLELANAVGITQGRLWEYEADRRFPRASALVAIAVALGVELRFAGYTITCPAKDLLRRAAKPLARQALNTAVQKGAVVRPDACQDCGRGKPQAHHEDYGKPLSVEWLCRGCHARRHRRSTNGVSRLSPAA